jgi:hypothetical protein
LFTAKKIPWLGYAIDRPAHSIESRFSCFPLLYPNYRPVSEVQGFSMKVPLRKKMVPSFEGMEHMEHRETYMPSLYPDERGDAQNAKS